MTINNFIQTDEPEEQRGTREDLRLQRLSSQEQPGTNVLLVDDEEQSFFETEISHQIRLTAKEVVRELGRLVIEEIIADRLLNDVVTDTLEGLEKENTELWNDLILQAREQREREVEEKRQLYYASSLPLHTGVSGPSEGLADRSLVGRGRSTPSRIGVQGQNNTTTTEETRFQEVREHDVAPAAEDGAARNIVHAAPLVPAAGTTASSPAARDEQSFSPRRAKIAENEASTSETITTEYRYVRPVTSSASATTRTTSKAEQAVGAGGFAGLRLSHAKPHEGALGPAPAPAPGASPHQRQVPHAAWSPPSVNDVGSPWEDKEGPRAGYNVSLLRQEGGTASARRNQPPNNVVGPLSNSVNLHHSPAAGGSSPVLSIASRSPRSQMNQPFQQEGEVRVADNENAENLVLDEEQKAYQAQVFNDCLCEAMLQVLFPSGGDDAQNSSSGKTRTGATAGTSGSGLMSPVGTNKSKSNKAKGNKTAHSSPSASSPVLSPSGNNKSDSLIVRNNTITTQGQYQEQVAASMQASFTASIARNPHIRTSKRTGGRRPLRHRSANKTRFSVVVPQAKASSTSTPAGSAGQVHRPSTTPRGTSRSTGTSAASATSCGGAAAKTTTRHSTSSTQQVGAAASEAAAAALKTTHRRTSTPQSERDAMETAYAEMKAGCSSTFSGNKNVDREAVLDQQDEINELEEQAKAASVIQKQYKNRRKKEVTDLSIDLLELISANSDRKR
ncbi:unnamed protein product [Amoebophrya sp. A120]|nr:unnamed protein product [Amoebophrya sp. A120]|eukprot:GSA120T00021916001.1